jgi:predicted porin
MNKKLMAVAVAAALGTPAVAMAQASTVQIYGTMFLEYNFVDQGTGPAGSRRDYDQFQTPGSNIGFKGEEALGGGLSAWFQCESTAAFHNGATGAGFCSRNSAIGFKGGFGNLFLGQWDTPHKRAQGVTRGMLNETGVYGTGFLMAGNSATYAGNANPGSFIRRQANTINYDSPNFGGFQAMVAVSTNQSASGVTSGSSAGKPRLWSVGLQYVNGPLAITGAFEKHNDFGTTATTATTGAVTGNASHGGSDKGWNVGATYTFPIGGGLKIGGVFFKQDYELGGFGAGSGEIDRKAWQVAADWKIVGPHGLRGGYARAHDTKGSSTIAVDAAGLTPCLTGTQCIAAIPGNNGADLWEIIYYYTFSKRTEVGVGYVRLDNDSGGRYALGGVAMPINGSKQDAFALHVKHTF